MGVNYSDTQLKQALAKMLPDVLEPKWVSPTTVGTNVNDKYFVIWWKGKATAVLDTELLHLCWLVMNTLNVTTDDLENYFDALDEQVHPTHICWGTHTHDRECATWQQRVIALARVKGIEV